ncbi:venom serine carboxypeptidase-like [Leguminivora glycinivorella]|uniref:venom serine carboxypeptidase-like n=1 Tax=Leguminivora glycinivorella TaxID=1035111 RepID=UPI00200FD0F5|nr:venom serine carboxypeptidase-like [Leguminivora glycinivorella]
MSFTIFWSWQAIVLHILLQYTVGIRVTNHTADDPGEPLFLTPYVERGDIATAKKLARVTLNNLEVESYAGFFTVNKTYNSNQFFWYFSSKSLDKHKAPVLLWLQGGPGKSSLKGLFLENGPITVKNGEFQSREYHWALNHHVIYIDNPVGVGFSFTKNQKGYCTDETQIGAQLYSTLTQFFQLFPDLQQNDFFITGESYAGKYVPALAYTILKRNSNGKTNINLKGLVIGGPWINPDSQRHFAPSKRCFTPAWLFTDNEAIQAQRRYVDNEFASVVTRSAVRKAIHVGNLSYCEMNWTVNRKYMGVDFCQSIAPWLAEILEHYPVTLYGGNKDDKVPYIGIVDFLRNHFNFTGADEYRSAVQYCWRVESELAGCVRRAHMLTEIYVLNATHYVPRDQPKRAWDMITRITHGVGFDQKEVCTAQSKKWRNVPLIKSSYSN